MSQEHIVVLIWLLVPSVMISLIAWRGFKQMRDVRRALMNATRDAE